MKRKSTDSDKNQKKQDQVQLNVNIVEHYIKTLSFDNYRSEVSVPSDAKPEIKIDINIDVLSKGGSQYEVCFLLKVYVFINNTKIFGLNLNYAGLCILEENMDVLQQEKMLNIFCPNIIFPFARRVIADITRDGCFQPMLINHVHFAEMYDKKIEAQEKVKKA